MARLGVAPDPAPATGSSHVELASISRSFGGVQAVRAVSLEVTRGEVHALVGENGAGKSSLSKMIAGLLSPDGGELKVDGHPVTFNSPREALSHGIATIAQELALVPGAAVTGSLRTADQQKVEILRAVSRGASFIIMDEPTAALSQIDTAKLHQVIRGLRDSGCTVLSVDALTAPGVRDVSLQVAPGEIVGLAGLVGAGRSELAHALVGSTRHAGGTVRVDGSQLRLRSPVDGLRGGIFLIPESRKEQGLLPQRSVLDNITLANLADYSIAGLIRTRQERRSAATLLKRLAIRAPHPGIAVSSLSGGNQQKALFARAAVPTSTAHR